VIAHAVSNELLFWDDVDRKVYLGLLQQMIEMYRWQLLTFVLMGNHVHLLVVAAACDLSGGLWWLHWKYAEHVHRRHPPRRGHVFESRPKTPPITNERYLFAVLRYIANNPVKHGFWARPAEYRWSAHRAILGLSSPMPLLATEDVLLRFSSDPGRARTLYEAFVTGEDPCEHDDVRRWDEGARPDRPPLTDLLAGGESVGAIRAAHFHWDYSMRAIASALGVSPTTISRRINGKQ
jgi:REP element-mobilizing transposase RayT